MMSDWEFNAKWWCRYCRIFVTNNKISRAHHENNSQHRRNVEKFIQTIVTNDKKKSLEEKKAKRILCELEATALEAYKEDLRKSGFKEHEIDAIISQHNNKKQNTSGDAKDTVKNNDDPKKKAQLNKDVKTNSFTETSEKLKNLLHGEVCTPSDTDEKGIKKNEATKLGDGIFKNKTVIENTAAREQSIHDTDDTLRADFDHLKRSSESSSSEAAPGGWVVVSDVIVEDTIGNGVASETSPNQTNIVDKKGEKMGQEKSSSVGDTLGWLRKKNNADSFPQAQGHGDPKHQKNSETNNAAATTNLRSRKTFEERVVEVDEFSDLEENIMPTKLLRHSKSKAAANSPEKQGDNKKRNLSDAKVTETISSENLETESRTQLIPTLKRTGMAGADYEYHQQMQM